MFKTFIASTALASLAFTIPQAASADGKDALLGAAVGAILNNAIRNEKEKKRTQKKRVVRAAPATLNSTYSRAERRQIQAALNAQGFPVGVVDGALGRKSRSAISQFQAMRGETATGQLTRAQFAALTASAFGQQPTMANRGLAPQEVALLQQSLMQLGFYRSTIDGVDGFGTQQAAMNYLASQGRTPVNTSRVQTTVMAAQAAGFQVPAYLMQEAQATMANAPFGTQQQPYGGQTQQAFGAQQQPFAAQPQQAFGAQQQPFAAQPQQAFGAQQQPFAAQPQQAFGAQQQPFAAQPQQGFGTQQQQPIGAQPGLAQPQQTFGVQPAGTLASAPQGTQQGLFPAPSGAAPQAQPAQNQMFATPGQQVPGQGQQLIQQQPQLVPQTAQQPLFPAPAQQAPAQQQLQQQAPLQQTGGQANTLFAAGTAVAPTPAQTQQSGLDIFSPGAANGAQVAQDVNNSGTAILPQAGQAAAFASSN